MRCAIARLTGLCACALAACGSSDLGPESPGSAGGAGAAASGAAGAAGAASVGSAGAGVGGGLAIAGAGGTVAAAGASAGASGGAPEGGSAGARSNGGASGSGGSAGGNAQATNGSIVPLYAYPSDASWKAIIAAKKAHESVRVIAIVNPDSGPGSTVDAAFTTGIANLVAASIVPIGYVSTKYTKRGQPAVKADVDKYRAAYPALQGIFFDEQSNQAGDAPFYSDVSSYAKAKGFELTVGNPGTSVPDSYLGTVDVMLIYESAGVPSLASLAKFSTQRGHFAIIPYAAQFDATYVKAARNAVGYVYITDDDLPNPWDTLPSSFADLLGALSP